MEKYTGKKYNDLSEVAPNILELLKKKSRNPHILKTIGSTDVALIGGLFPFLSPGCSISANITFKEPYLYYRRSEETKHLFRILLLLTIAETV